METPVDDVYMAMERLCSSECQGSILRSRGRSDSQIKQTRITRSTDPSLGSWLYSYPVFPVTARAVEEMERLGLVKQATFQPDQDGWFHSRVTATGLSWFLVERERRHAAKASRAA